MSGGGPPQSSQYGRQPPTSRQPSTSRSDPYPSLYPLGREGSYINFENSTFIDVRTHNGSENAALTGGQSEREQYWDRQLRYNLNNWRSNSIAMVQVDSRGRLWGVNMQCNTSWSEMRQSEIAPRFSLIWDRDLSEWSLYCTQSQGSNFILSGNSA